MAKKSLTAKAKKFIDAYLGPANYNATEAAKLAGYSKKTAYSIGHELLKKPEIKEAVSIQLSESAMSAEETLKHLAERARDKKDSASMKALELLAKHHGLLEHIQKQQTLNIDLDQFNDAELKRIAAGEDPLQIMADREDDN